MISTRLSAIAFAAFLASTCASLTGCGAAADRDDAEDTTEESELSTSEALTFKGTTDTALSIKLEVLDGIKTTTMNKRFIKATARRASKSFESWCSLSGSSDGTRTKTRVECSVGVETVSNDDDESLTFALESDDAGATFVLTDREYVGDGTFLGDEATVIGAGSMWDPPSEATPLAAKRGSKLTTERDPFAVGALIHEALAGVTGASFYLSDLGVSVPVNGYASWNLSEKVEFSTRFAVGKTRTNTEFVPSGVSVLATAGDLSTGLAAPADITARVKAALPKKP
jgi:hypothetical protein